MRFMMMGGQLSANDTRSLHERYCLVRRQSERLAEPLSPEDRVLQSMPDTSPTKWHLAHTTWFFETFVLAPYLPGYRPFRAGYDVLFNSYYHSVGEQFARPRRGQLSRPSSAEIDEYRRAVDEAMLPLLEAPTQQVRGLVTLGLHHEQQHQELLLTDIKHALFQNPLYPAYLAPTASRVKVSTRGAPSPPIFVGFEGGTVEIGVDPSSPDFSFDNEGPRHRVLLADFELASRPINNGDVLAFIEGGGYDDALLWLSDGWAFRSSQNAKHPLYWVSDAGGGYRQFTARGLEAIDPAETACHLNYFEADAIARFFGARLPTEHEWECAASRQNLVPLPFDINSIEPPCPEHPAPGKLAQMLGGVWEWTRSAYAAYPGFVPSPGAVGEYNGKFMHGQMVLRGGSCATPDGHIRTTYRNFFPGSAQWQFSGARLAKGDHTP